MANDSHIRPAMNSKMIVEPDDSGNPRLALFAIRQISEGEEVRYDYGVPNLSWRKKVS